MTAKFVKFDPSNGRILLVGEVLESMIEQQGENVWVGSASPQFDYMKDGQPARRPDMPVTLSGTTVACGVGELTLAGVPAGAKLNVYGPINMEGVVERAGEVTLTFALAGTYNLALECFPYLDLNATIHAV